MQRLALAVVLCLIGYNRYASQSLWSLSRSSVLPVVLAVVAVGLFVPVVGNSYVKGRFATLGQDFKDRLEHWKDGLAMIDPGWVAPAFGMGLGSFPRTYFWRNSRSEFPGVQQFRREGGQHHPAARRATLSDRLRRGTPRFSDRGHSAFPDIPAVLRSAGQC